MVRLWSCSPQRNGPAEPWPDECGPRPGRRLGSPPAAERSRSLSLFLSPLSLPLSFSPPLLLSLSPSPFLPLPLPPSLSFSLPLPCPPSPPPVRDESWRARPGGSGHGPSGAVARSALRRRAAFCSDRRRAGTVVTRACETGRGLPSPRCAEAGRYSVFQQLAATGPHLGLPSQVERPASAPIRAVSPQTESPQAMESLSLTVWETPPWT